MGLTPQTEHPTLSITPNLDMNAPKQNNPPAVPVSQNVRKDKANEPNKETMEIFREDEMLVFVSDGINIATHRLSSPEQAQDLLDLIGQVKLNAAKSAMELAMDKVVRDGYHANDDEARLVADILALANDLNLLEKLNK